MKRRVAIVSSCCPPLPGHPVTGGGLRTAQLVETVRAAGHTPVLLLEAEAIPESAPAAISRAAFAREELPARLKKLRPSIVVVEQWALVPSLGETNRPLVIDLHGSLLLENVYRRGEADLVLDAGTKIEALRRADLLLTPSSTQLHHFGAWATLAGFDPRSLPLELMPLALPDPPPPTRRKKKPALNLVYGGARWPWIDSFDAITAVADTVAELPKARLDVFTYEPPRHGLDFDDDLGTWAELDKALVGREYWGIQCDSAVPHSEWLRFLSKTATVALDLWQPNPERMLAATTRTIELLWSGLPVITVQGATWAEELLESGAGWTVAPGDSGALQSLIRELAENPERIAAASSAASRLVREQHSIKKAGTALAAFCKRPQRAICTGTSLITELLSVERTHLEEAVRSLKRAHEDEHRQLVERHQQLSSEQRSSHEGLVQELSKQHSELVSTIRDKAVEELETARKSHLTARDEQEDKHRLEIARLLTERQAEVRKIIEHWEKQSSKSETQQKKKQAKQEEASGKLREQVEGQKVELEVLRQQLLEHKTSRVELRESSESQLQALEELRTQLEIERRKSERLQAEREEFETLQEERGQLITEVEVLRSNSKADRKQLEDWRTSDEQLRTQLEAAREERERLATEFQVVQVASESERVQFKAQTEELHVLREQLGSRTTELEVLRATSEAERTQLQGREEHTETLRGQLTEESAERKFLRAQLEEARVKQAALEERLKSAEDRLRAERARHREESTRLEVEARAAQAKIAELLAQLQTSVASRTRARVLDLPGMLPGRTAPALRLARLWLEHALDREGD